MTTTGMTTPAAVGHNGRSADRAGGWLRLNADGPTARLETVASIQADRTTASGHTGNRQRQQRCEGGGEE